MKSQETKKKGLNSTLWVATLIVSLTLMLLILAAIKRFMAIVKVVEPFILRYEDLEECPE